MDELETGAPAAKRFLRELVSAQLAGAVRRADLVRSSPAARVSETLVFRADVGYITSQQRAPGYLMALYPVAPGLRFNDCLFTEPVRLTHWIPPQTPGIVAVLARDCRWAPKPFQPLYFAEFGNGAHRTFWPVHGELYAAVLPMPFSTSAQRRALRNELISAYNPTHQAHHPHSVDELTRCVEELETRQYEQHAQIAGMLAHLCRLFEPLPVKPKRPIGFVAAEAC